MTSTPHPAAASPLAPRPLLDDLANSRAVDRIERAEREDPFCLCGAPNAAIAHGDTVWLECSTLRQPGRGIAGLLSRLAVGLGHTRQVIVELPRAA
jgi:hypothetical protein